MEILGPGMWYTIHKMALLATTDSKKRDFIVFVNTLCRNMDCAKCRVHSNSYLDKHSLSGYWKIFRDGKDIGFFKWSFEFHNEANRHAGRQIMDFETAYALYTDQTGICKNCDHIETKESAQGNEHTEPISSGETKIPIIDNTQKEVSSHIPPVLLAYIKRRK